MNVSEQNQRRELRVFFSSTFRDMAAERDHLQSHVFPRIERVCVERRVQFTPIDLRWGITESEAKEGHVVRICLEEIDRCVPFFIGFIGERYGWAPRPEDIHNFEELAESFAMLKALNETALSITEMEMLHGALEANQEVQSAFFFRDKNLTEQLAQLTQSEDFFESDPQAQHRLTALREIIKSSDSPVINYDAIEQFGESVEETLISMIETTFPIDEPVNELMIKHGLHQSMTERLSRYYMLPPVVSSLLAAISEGDPSLHVLCSDSGEGKSAAVAYLRGQLEQAHILSLAHYVSLDDRPSPEIFIKRLCELLCTLLETQQETSDSIDEYTDLLFDLMEKWHFESEQYLVILVDDADLWRDGEWGAALQWLPPELPMGMSIVCTSAQPSFVEQITQHAEGLKPQLHRLDSLSTKEIKHFSERYLASFRKKLSPKQIDQLSTGKVCSNAQALKILLDELRVYGSFEGLDDLITKGIGCSDTSALSMIHLETLERAFGAAVVNRLFTTLSATIHGMNELDLAAYIGVSQMALSRIILHSGAHIDSMSGRLQLAHQHIRSAVRHRYQLDELKLIEARRSLAQWLDGRTISFERVVEQLKLYEAVDDIAALLKVLSDLERTEKLIGNREWLEYWTKSDESYRAGELYFESYSEFGIEIDSLKIALERFDHQVKEGTQYPVVLDDFLAQQDLNPLIFSAWNLSSYIAELGDEERGLRLMLWAYQHFHLLEQNEADQEHNLSSQELILANLFGRNGLVDRSINLYEGVRKRVKGRDQVIYLEATHNLALILREASRWDRVEGLLLECINAYTELYSGENPTTLTSALNLANYYHDMSRYEEAIEISEKVLEIFQRRQGIHHVSTLSLVNNLALTYHAAGQNNKALGLLEDCHVALMAHYGPNHPKTLQALSNITNVQSTSGQHELAAETAIALLAQRREQLGDEHLDTLNSMYNVALIRKEEGELEEAIDLLERVTKGRTKQLGADHVETLSAESELAEVLSETDDHYEKGSRLRRSVLERRKAILGDEHFDTLHSLNLVAIEHAVFEDYNEALSLFNQVYQGRRKLLGDGHEIVMESASNLARMLYHEDKFDEAEAVILKQTQSAFSAEVPLPIACALNLELLERYVDEERDEAWAFFAQHLEHAKRTYIYCGEEYFEDWNQAIGHLGELDEERTADLVEQWSKTAREELGEDQLRVGHMCRALSQALQDLGEEERALPYHLELLKISNELNGEESDITLRVKYALGELYETLEKRDESERLYREVIERLRLEPVEDEDFLLEVMVTLGHLLFEVNPSELQERRALFEEVERIRIETQYDDHFEIALIQAQLGWELLIDGELKQAHKKYKSFRDHDELEELMEIGFIEEWEMIWLKLGLAIINARRAKKNQRKPLVKSARKKLKRLIEELGDDHPRCLLAAQYVP